MKKTESKDLEQAAEEIEMQKSIDVLSFDFQREDLNALQDAVNELIKAHNAMVESH